MCCFVAPLAEAVVASVVKAKAKRDGNEALAEDMRVLERMLWGGGLVLMLEHLWNGELSWKFPFISGYEEIVSVGLAMCGVVSGVWWMMRGKRIGKVAEVVMSVGLMFGVDWVVG